MDSMEQLENRVGKLEDTVAPLAAQMFMLINTVKETNVGIKETNASIQDLSKRMEDNYVSERICAERCATARDDIKDFKSFRTWVYTSVIMGLASTITLLITVFIHR